MRDSERISSKRLISQDEKNSQFEIELSATAFVQAVKSRQVGRRLGNELIDASPEEIRIANADSITWGALAHAEDKEPGVWDETWQRIKDKAREELKSGFRSADAVGVTDHPWTHARYVVLLEAYKEDWKPRGEIEAGLVELLAQTRTMAEHWLRITAIRTKVEFDLEKYQVQIKGKWREMVTESKELEEEARNEAARWMREHLRIVRALRDLRRYPVFIKNEGQVNIGNQQTNVTKAVKRKKKEKSKVRAVAPGTRPLRVVGKAQE